MNIRLEEYKLLREEIMAVEKECHDYISILYVSLAAILAFAFSSKNPIAFLLPYVTIFPLFMIFINKEYQMYKIATYLSVFLEDEIKWETRLLSLKMESKQYKMRMYSGLSVSPYVFSGVASTGLCLFQLSAKDIKDIICLTGGAAVFLFAVLCLIAGSKKRPGEIRAIYVEEWKRLKAIEEKENKKAEN